MAETSITSSSSPLSARLIWRPIIADPAIMATAIIMRLMPPTWTMLTPGTSSSMFWVEPRPARTAPMTKAMLAETTTIALRPVP
jgi:hypothetical protein